VSYLSRGKALSIFNLKAEFSLVSSVSGVFTLCYFVRSVGGLEFACA